MGRQIMNSSEIPVNNVAQNTDRELYREGGNDYSPSIHVTESGGIGINVGGHVLVASLRNWHDAGNKVLTVDPTLPSWRYRLAMWLLRW